MDVEAEKLKLIKWLVDLQDTELIKQFCELQRKSESAVDMDEVVGSNPGGSSITVRDLVARAEESERDIQAGRVHDLEDVLEEMEKRLDA